MKYIPLIVLSTLTLSCAEAQDANTDDPQMTTPTCVTYPEWTGKNIDDIDMTMIGDRPTRVLKPDSMATMDFIPNRLNINVDADGVILTQECG